MKNWVCVLWTSASVSTVSCPLRIFGERNLPAILRTARSAGSNCRMLRGLSLAHSSRALRSKSIAIADSLLLLKGIRTSHSCLRVFILVVLSLYHVAMNICFAKLPSDGVNKIILTNVKPNDCSIIIYLITPSYRGFILFLIWITIYDQYRENVTVFSNVICKLCLECHWDRTRHMPVDRTRKTD